MTDLPEHPTPTLSRRALIILILLAGVAMILLVTGDVMALVAILISAIIEGVGIAAVLVAAGGFGHLLLKRLYPKNSPKGLQIVTSCAAGLWILSTAVLLVGSLTTGLLEMWFWWPVLAAGVLLAGIQSRKHINKWHMAEKFDGRALLWVVIAAAVGMYIAEATWSPGFTSGRITGDTYDVLEYHLQVPREFYNAQHIGELKHNCYSYYPLGVEMLYLLAFCLRGGAYEGMFLAKMMHGMFAGLAVAGIFLALKRDDEHRGRFSAGLLATAPFVLYLSWLAMAELAEICYIALAMLWLREWLARANRRTAVVTGLMLGAACAVKYLSVGLIVAPVIAVMIAAGLIKPRRLAQTALAILATGVLFSPWLVRNFIYTGNPVFPLATSMFGRGHWSEESEQRWVNGHGPQFKPPVPQPADWKESPHPDKIELLYRNFIAYQWFGTLLMIAAGVGLCLIAAYPSRGSPWNWAIIAILAIQVAVWAAFTHEMPGRFLVPALVPICLLAGEALARLSRVVKNPFSRNALPSPRGPWGLPPAAIIFLAIVGVNLTITYNIHLFGTFGMPPALWPGDEIAAKAPPYNEAALLPEGSRILLIGEAKAFYFPADTVYATAFDSHPLAELIDSGNSPEEVLARLKQMGITHLWVEWLEINRLATTYGYPASLSEGLTGKFHEGSPPALPAIDALMNCGVTEYKTLPMPESFKKWPKNWPMITIYSLYGQKAPPPTTAPADK